MSAESPRKATRQGGHVVTPQPVSDRSIIESVAGFINEVVPQAYTSLPVSESKEAITWARFEYGDINDPALYPDTADEHSSTPPLLLVLGYGNGVQVWAVPANGEATEVLSWRQGVVRTLRVLPTPLADSPVPDAFTHKRPLVALCDSAGPGPQFCSLSFISLRAGDQVKSIKFKNPVNDVLANRRSVVVTFPERIAVFDASTLEDRLTVTTCYPSPGPNPNPVALGSRWLAYSERRLLPARRSSGGTEGEGVQSYTATVLHAAKSLGKGLRELGETVASSLSGTAGPRGAGMVGPGQGSLAGGGSDALQPGIITILDAQGTSSTSNMGEEVRTGDSGPGLPNADIMVAHFAAHSEPLVALAFDLSGMLLLTADKRGHDFHVFRVQPHPGGPSLAAVHHLYVLHRGDTTAKVQDIAFAADSRWVAVSTLRGTTHVFPITPYGGPAGIRTHATPHVVNRLSRFHRSAGLTADGRNSPVPHETVSAPTAMPYPNPRLPPYPHPTTVAPLAQIRQPMIHSPAPLSPAPSSQQGYHRNPSARSLGRTPSTSEEGLPGGGVPLRVTACFAPPRAWLVGSPTVPRESSSKVHKRAVDSLFVMACHGSLIEYDLEPKHAAGIPKEKVCDDTPVELEVQAKAQWVLLHPPHTSELAPPLPSSSPLMGLPDRLPPASDPRPEDADERWLSQVEIVTHAGPHRRLWMGPQFTFKTYTASVGVPLSLLEMEAVEVGIGGGSRPARSNPVNMPLGGTRPIVPVLIESGSASSYEQSPRLMDMYGGDGGDSDGSAGPGDTQLREDLADAMMESPGVPIRDTGRRVLVTMRSSLLGKRSSIPIEKVVNPVGTVITISMPVDEEGGTSQTSDSSLEARDGELEAAEGGKVEGVVRWPTAIKLPQAEAEAQQTQGPSEEEGVISSFGRETDFSIDSSERESELKPSKHEDKIQLNPSVKKNKKEDKKVRLLAQDQGDKLITTAVLLSEVGTDDEPRNQRKKKQRVSDSRESKILDTVKMQGIDTEGALLVQESDLELGQRLNVRENVSKLQDTDEFMTKRKLNINKERASKAHTRDDLLIEKSNIGERENTSKVRALDNFGGSIKSDIRKGRTLKMFEPENKLQVTSDPEEKLLWGNSDMLFTKERKAKSQAASVDSDTCRDVVTCEYKTKIEKKSSSSKKHKRKNGEDWLTKVTDREEAELDSFVSSEVQDKSSSLQTPPYQCIESEETNAKEHKRFGQDVASHAVKESVFSLEKKCGEYELDKPLEKEVVIAVGSLDDVVITTTSTAKTPTNINDDNDEKSQFLRQQEGEAASEKIYGKQYSSNVKKDPASIIAQSKSKSRKLRAFLTTDEVGSKASSLVPKYEHSNTTACDDKSVQKSWIMTSPSSSKGETQKARSATELEKDGFHEISHKAPFRYDSISTKLSSAEYEMPAMKTWSSVVSSSLKDKSQVSSHDDSISPATTCKEKLWSDIAAAGLNPNILVSDDVGSLLDINDTCKVDDPDDLESSEFMDCFASKQERKEITDPEEDIDIKNNNSEDVISEINHPNIGASIFKSAQEDVPVITPQRSWSSIVSSSPKTGASSVEDCSGEYDSNESKEYGDPGLDELEERDDGDKSHSSELLTANESLSTVPSESSMERGGNEEEASTEAAALLPSKKNRKAKKKRR